jgi:hypothetical protein
MMRRLALWLGAFVLWMLAIVGAIAVAVWLRLPLLETRGLVIVIAFIAFFGAFLPILRLTSNRKS